MVGTPPFVPPEALQLQALDGRADLYSLGALAYCVLTGRHAYPARTLRRAARPVAQRRPRARAATTPEHARGARSAGDGAARSSSAARGPRSAAEVMERLSGIAGAAAAASCPRSARAYLVAPTLVGRDDAAARACARELVARAAQAAAQRC